MRIIKPRDIKNLQYYIIGFIFIIINYIRHSLLGYRTPRDFSIDQIERAVEYDFNIVANWVKYLRSYSAEEYPLSNKVILELGPGPDLGIGLILLAMGVKKYIAIDIYDSVEKPLFWKTNKNSIQSYQQLTTRGFSKKGKFGTFSTESFMDWRSLHLGNFIKNYWIG